MRKSVVILAMTGLLSPSVAGQETSAPDALTLRAAIGIARASHPAARAAEADVLAVSQNVRKAFVAGHYPKLSFSAYSGLVPEARGDIFNSPDLQTDLDDWGPFGRFSLDLTQPLVTFGRAGAAVAMARESSSAAASRRDAFLEDLSLEVVKAYWGVLAAVEAESLARESGDRYRELLREIEKRLGREDSVVDDEDLLEARTHELEIETLIQSSFEKRDVAGRTLNVLLAREVGSPVVLAAQAPPVFDAADELLRRMVLVAAEARPEIRGLAAAARASEADIRLKKKQSLPLIFVAGNFGLAHAPHRTDQTNPFVTDNFNYRNLGMAFGLRWEPDLFGGQADVRQAEAAHKALVDRLAAARDMAALDAARAFAEARRNVALLAAARRSLASAKSWLRLSQENWDTGLGDAYRLLRAYGSYFGLRAASIEREYALNVSLAALARILGDTGDYVDWVERGRVIID
jgi:outer membrane protein TolC